jgi:cellulose synthase/poly-beta-1,6-N-acetylglucosamine synthase-like glycosyltransferase
MEKELFAPSLDAISTIENKRFALDTLDTVKSAHNLDTLDDTVKSVIVKRVHNKATQQNQHKQSDKHPVTYDLTVVTPTRNERDNVTPLLQVLQKALDGVNTEIIFVDDSDDDTPDIIRNAIQRFSHPAFHIHLEHRPKGDARIGGLATAVDLGLRSAQARYVAVIDADLQHPPAQLRVFYDEATKQNVDLVLASRYIKGGNYGGLDGISRLLFSVGLKTTAKILFPEHLARVSDPLGGFFLLRRSLLNDVTLRPIGYKILLEILIRCQWNELIEVPYHFQQRQNGQSKADLKQGVMALQHMRRLLCEVPSAGRVWKWTGLALINIVCTLLLVLLNTTISGLGQSLNTCVFVAMVGLNYWLVNRYLFPAPPLSERIQHAMIPEPYVALTESEPAPQTETTKATYADSVRSKWLARFSFFICVIAIAGIVVTLPGAWIVIGALFVGFSIISRKKVTTNNMVTMLLGMLVGISSIDYLSWRFAVTNWPSWWIAIPLLAAETLGAIHTLGFQYTLWPWKQPELRLSGDPTKHPVFVFIPTVNEGATILEPTLRGALAARKRYLEQYPHGQVTIVICNDGYVAKNPDWQTVEELAQRMGVVCVTRKVGGGAKAGNIEHARQFLKATDDALLVIFDADQIATPEFLLKTVPAFGDPSIGWVQTGQYYSNLENPVARWADDQQSMFYNLLCPGKASLNSAFICGTNVVIRAKALDQIGGLPQDSVTEDFSASIALHPHWRSVFLTDILATGLGPLDMPSYLKQQRRWAIGTLGVLRTHWREIFLPSRHGLSLSQRIQYFLACTHYLCGIRDLIYLLSPMLFILTSIPAVRGSTLSAFLWHFLPYWLVSMAALWYAGRGITGLRGIIIGFGSFPVLIESLLSMILQRKVGFSVTSKQRSNQQSFSHLLIYVVFMLAGIFCIGLTFFSDAHQQASVFISVMWIVYSLLLLGCFLWLNLQDYLFQKKAQQKVVTAERPSYPVRLKERETGVRPAINLAISFMLACVLFTSGFVHIDTVQPSPFVVSTQSITQPLLGVSLPAKILPQRVPTLEQAFDTQFAIVGRTQDIYDQFDLQWANQLASQHAHPWITLEFGVFEKDGQSPASASLNAIANGVHDNDLKRWAKSIRDYAQPVYLTILLHADRNWALSSGVANGGIPQDISRAWLHVQAVFQAAGAYNVAWVWAPADPAHDAAYSPPASAINVILLSMISYPHTQWVDPTKTLQAVIKQHPNKPIIVEVSAAGDKNQKALWLSKVGNAINSLADVYALIYHEGSPALNPKPSENIQWSMLSDKNTQQTLQHIFTNLQTHQPGNKQMAKDKQQSKQTAKSSLTKPHAQLAGNKQMAKKASH